METGLDKTLVLLRRLISDLQGAPYPGTVNNELYTLWYEHIQDTVQECLEFMSAKCPEERKQILQAIGSFSELF